MHKYTEKEKENNRIYRQEHKEERLIYQRNYRNTPIGRAERLIGRYRYRDRKYGRGEPDITSRWLADVFRMGCFWCGEQDFTRLGLDRLDNSKPHNKSNCVVCCTECNRKKGKLTVAQYIEKRKESEI